MEVRLHMEEEDMNVLGELLFHMSRGLEIDKMPELCEVIQDEFDEKEIEIIKKYWRHILKNMPFSNTIERFKKYYEEYEKIVDEYHG